MKRIIIAILTVAAALSCLASCADSGSFTVTFDSDGGSEVAAQSVKAGDKATAPDDPAKEGYTFFGWYSGGSEYDFDTEVTEDVTLKAKWVENTPALAVYTVTFDSVGGSAVTEQKVESGSKAVLPTAPTKEGFSFAGWYNNTAVYDFNAPVTSNLSLKANWVSNVPLLSNYIVVFDTDGGSAVAPQIVVEGSKLTKPNQDPTKAGYTFIGWFVGGSEYDFNSAVSSNLSVKAKWKGDDISVKFYNQDHTTFSEVIIERGTAVPTDKLPRNPIMNSGYVFSGAWGTEENGSWTFVDATDAILQADETAYYPGFIATSIVNLAGTWAGVYEDGTDSIEFNIAVDPISYQVSVDINYTRFDDSALYSTSDGSITSILFDGSDVYFTYYDEESESTASFRITFTFGEDGVTVAKAQLASPAVELLKEVINPAN